MRFNLSFSSESKKVGPIIPTKVLNTNECGIAAVGISFFGKLAYRPVGHGFAVTTGISHVYILQSTAHNQNRHARSVEVDFDIYLMDGRVIEVHSFDRATIQAALAYAPVKDVRAASRRARGR